MYTYYQLIPFNLLLVEQYSTTALQDMLCTLLSCLLYVYCALISTLSSDKLIKEAKERLLRVKGNPGLEKVADINVLCGVIKDFLRNLREPLLTFRMHNAFMQATGQYLSHLLGLTQHAVQEKFVLLVV